MIDLRKLTAMIKSEEGRGRRKQEDAVCICPIQYMHEKDESGEEDPVRVCRLYLGARGSHEGFPTSRGFAKAHSGGEGKSVAVLCW